jgi:hypothetical protein
MKQPEVGPPLDGRPTFVGALRLSFVFANWGWPSVRLTLCTEGVVIGPSSVAFRPFVPTRRFRFDDLVAVQAVGSSFFTRGPRFVSQSSGRWAIFWTLNRLLVIDQLRDRVDVKADPERLNYLFPGPRGK